MEGKELAPYTLFASLSKDELNTVGRYLDQVDVRAGRTLANEGAFAHEFFVIESGQATVTRGEDLLRKLGPGDFFGEIALVETERRTATVTALTDMRVMVMHSRDFHSMLTQAPSVAKRLKEAVAERSER